MKTSTPDPNKTWNRRDFLGTTLAFGNARPPVPAEVVPESGPVQLLKATYPRPLQQQRFWAPLQRIGGPAWDFGWLGVYLLSYLPVMALGNKLLRVA